MLAFLKRLLWDESAFERYARLFLLSGGAGLMSMATSWQLPDWFWQIATRETWMLVAGAMLGVGGLIGAGEKNPEVKQ
jgi:hypothetical protein